MSDTPPIDPPADKPVKKPRKQRAKIAPPPGLDPMAALTRDLKTAALTLGDAEARFVVDTYYQAQDDRIRAAHQVRALGISGEPHEVLAWMADQDTFREKQILKTLDAYSQSRPEGLWGRSIVGIGPVIVAGLMAHIRIERAPTAGSIWRFAGLDPTNIWLPKTKRPWNAALKRLCFIAGESFVKFASHERDSYGKVYKNRREYEIANNDAGHYVDQARQTLEEKNFAKDTDALAWYSGCFPAGTFRAWNDIELEARVLWPDDSSMRAQWLNKSRATYLMSVRVDPGKGLQMLPPARILLRSQRVAVKLFLSHWHWVLHEIKYGTPPRMPYILDENTHFAHPEHAVHTTFIRPPNWPMEPGTDITESTARLE